MERGFCYDFYFFGEIRGELRTNVIKNLVKLKFSCRSRKIEKNESKLNCLSCFNFHERESTQIKRTFALRFRYPLPPVADAVVAVFTSALLFSDNSSSLLNDSSIAGLGLTVKQ